MPDWLLILFLTFWIGFAYWMGYGDGRDREKEERIFEHIAKYGSPLDKE